MTLTAPQSRSQRLLLFISPFLILFFGKNTANITEKTMIFEKRAEMQLREGEDAITIVE
jgi:hypothetical protein